jgi:hypothetical protein
MVSTAILRTVQTIKHHLARQWTRLAASEPRPVPRALLLATGTLLGTLILVEPVVAQSTIGDALCGTGADKLLEMAIGLLAIMLGYLSIYDLYGGFKAGQGGDAKQRAQAGSYYRAGGKKLVGAVIIAGSPDFLRALGFTLLDCVSVAQIFA